MAKADPGDLSQRIDALREQLSRNPEDESAWNRLGLALLDLCQPKEAIQPFRRAVELDPEAICSHRDLGRALLESGATVEAVEQFARAIALAEKKGERGVGREIHYLLRQAE